VRKAPVVARASRLTSSCNSSARPVVQRTLPPFHHNSAPNMATDWTHADMTLLQFAGESSNSPGSYFSRFIAFLSLFSLVAWCSFSVTCVGGGFRPLRALRTLRPAGCLEFG